MEFCIIHCSALDVYIYFALFLSLSCTCAVLLCLVVCLNSVAYFVPPSHLSLQHVNMLASFFLPSHLLLQHVNMYMYVSIASTSIYM